MKGGLKMLACISSATLHGVDGRPVSVEATSVMDFRPSRSSAFLTRQSANREIV